MLKVMITAVGKRDPYAVDKDKNLTEGSILGAVRELCPDIVFLLYTIEQPDKKTNSTEANSRETKAEINRLYPQIKVYERPLNLPDPTDHAQIIKQFKEEILFIKEKYANSNPHFIISVSSGTSQMQNSFLVLVNSNLIKAELYQVIDPQFLKEGEPRTRAIHTHFLEEENQINRARRYYKNYYFKVAADELLELALNTIFPERQKKAEIFLELLEGYYFWDLYQHKEALGKLTKAYESINKFYNMKELAGILAAQISMLTKIIEIGPKEHYINLLDLYHNALRRKKGGQYADVISRYRRLHEGICYYLCREKLGVEPGREVERQPQWVKSYYKSYKPSARIQMKEIAELYLVKLNRPIIKDKLAADMRIYDIKRNDSINAHGMNPVYEEDANRAMKLLKELFKEAFADCDIDDYVFSKEKLAQVEKCLFDSL
ncbi:MAG: hypothetical protein ACOX3R_09405 [Desulfitobacteriia bacterium]